MPFYYRNASGRPTEPARGFMRVLTAVALAGYPAGCVVRLVGSGGAAQGDVLIWEVAGFGLIILSLAAFCFIAPSYLQRIIGEERSQLDEFELDLRRRAYAFSYQAFTGLTLIGLIYLGLAFDSARIALWTPSEFEHWNALIWGALLYAFVLPTAYLSWTAPAPVGEAED